MKRFFLLMLCCIFSFSVYAQEHQTFMGIPIDGSLTSFASQLEAKGFEKLSVGDSSVTLEGQFSGSKRVVIVYCTPITKIVYQVAVVLRESTSWSSLKSTYRDFKSILITKYGQPTGKEEFITPYYEGDGYEMTALRNGKCNYTQIFYTENGSIMLWISSVLDGSVLINYYDKLNDDLCDAEESSLKYNDL